MSSTKSAKEYPYIDFREAIYRRVCDVQSAHQNKNNEMLEKRDVEDEKSNTGSKFGRKTAIAAGLHAGALAVGSAAGGNAAAAGGSAVGGAGIVLGKSGAALAVKSAGAAAITTAGVGLLPAIAIASAAAAIVGGGIVGLVWWKSENRGKWKKIRLLGKGQFGEVHVCKKPPSDEEFAMKSIPLMSDEESIECFQREIKLLSEIDHPHILKCIEVEETKSEICMVMELMPCSVGQLSREEPLDENEARVISGDILDGIFYLHENDILHGDIKGNNVLVDSYGIAKIADFGIAKYLKNQQNSLMTTTNAKGTVCYMPPEMMEDKRGQKSDIWAFACTVYEMLAGSPLFRDCSLMSICRKHQNLEHRTEISNFDLLSTSAQDFINSMFVPYEDRPHAVEVMRHDWLRDFTA